MSKGLRLSEKWFNRGLWLLALVFAGFLIGLGGLVVSDLPQVERTLDREAMLDQAKAKPLKGEIAAFEKEQRERNEERERAALAHTSAKNEVANAQASLRNWLATRSVTEQSEQNPEVLRRTRELDTLKAKEREAERKLEAIDGRLTELRQTLAERRRSLAELEKAADERLAGEQRRQELRVFLYRLLLTLPLLVIAAWLFLKKRQSTYWPFVWGFILFALFAFFVELVPYLPSYGGYVRYAVGIVLTILIGHYTIRAMQRYLARQKAVEAQPESARREQLSYDLAMTRLAKKVCPGCERSLDLSDPSMNHCPHCGIALFDHCPVCQTRKNAFARYCHHCGAPATAATVQAGEA